MAINKAELTVITNNATRVYGDTHYVYATLTSTITGFRIGSNPTYGRLNSNRPRLTAPHPIQSSDVGSNYTISANGGTAKNYSFSYANNGKFSFNLAALTVTTNNATRVYGNSDPTFTSTITGFKLVKPQLQCTASAFSPTYTTTAVQSSDVGDYTISAAGGTAKNFSFSYANNGKLTINKAELT